MTDSNRSLKTRHITFTVTAEAFDHYQAMMDKIIREGSYKKRINVFDDFLKFLSFSSREELIDFKIKMLERERKGCASGQVH